MRTAASPVAWDDWGAAAFDRADRENKPVFLYLFDAWSAVCRRFDHETLAAGPLAALLVDAFVPVRVDADLRPDIADRYGLGGWPSLLVLTPEGDVLTGGRAADGATLVGQLARVRDVFRSRRRELQVAARATAAEPAEPRRRGPPVPSALLETFLAGVPDPGDSSPSADVWMHHPAALRVQLALVRARGGESDRARAEAWLERLADALIDRRTGAVTPPDPSGDGTGEQVVRLPAQAAVLEALADAVETLSGDGPRALLAGVSAFLRRRLRHPSGGFVHVLVDPPEGARAVPAHAVADLRRFVDGNAAAARALLRTAQVTGDGSLAELGILVIERVVATAYQRGVGLAHVIDPQPAVRGWLGDQMWAARAAIDASDASGMQVYLDLAEELMRLALQTHWNPDTGAFRDRAPDPAIGRLALPRYPLPLNGVAAQVLAGLARRAGDEDLAATGRDLVDACAPLVGQAGPDAAELVLAAIDLPAG